MKLMTRLLLVLAAAVAAGSCDKVPLLAPTGSTVALSANATTIPTGGAVGLTAFVTESAGTAVQNGTTVRFNTTLGTVTPASAQTTNGIAVATFNAGDQSGVATITAVSGGSTGTGTGGGTGGTTTPVNTVKITIGTAAVNKITVSANPSSVGPSGGSVTVTATALDASGGVLPGVPITFSSDQGAVNPSVATTDVSGHASTTLTTAAQTVVTATSGAQSATVTVSLRAGPAITISCAVNSGTGSTCASVQANASTNNVTVTFTVSKASGSSNLQSSTLNFGDGSSQSLGNLAGGSATATHIYGGPSGSSTVGYTAIVSATDVNAETTTATSTVTVTPRQQLAVSLSASTGTPSGGHTPITFTATVTPAVGGADVVQKYEWDFDNDGTVDATTSGNTTTHFYTTGSGLQVASVKVTTTDGRTATGQTEVNP
jgi:hypothetical protein